MTPMPDEQCKKNTVLGCRFSVQRKCDAAFLPCPRPSVDFLEGPERLQY
jgi:hypothetical protein